LPYTHSFTPAMVAGLSLLSAGRSYVAMALASRKAKAATWLVAAASGQQTHRNITQRQGKAAAAKPLVPGISVLCPTYQTLLSRRMPALYVASGKGAA